MTYHEALNILRAQARQPGAHSREQVQQAAVLVFRSLGVDIVPQGAGWDVRCRGEQPQQYTDLGAALNAALNQFSPVARA